MLCVEVSFLIKNVLMYKDLELGENLHSFGDELQCVDEVVNCGIIFLLKKNFFVCSSLCWSTMYYSSACREN